MNQFMYLKSESNLRHATESDFEEIKNLFRKHKAIFPHVRMDRMLRKIKNKQVIFDNGVLIAYVVYKRKGYMGEHTITKGECVLNQIISISGKGSSVLQRFFNYVKTNVYLSVRKDNVHAMTFYEKNGMINIGNIEWSNGLKGVIYKKGIDDAQT